MHEDLNAKMAAIAAGYSEKPADCMGRENLRKPLFAVSHHHITQAYLVVTILPPPGKGNYDPPRLPAMPNTQPPSRRGDKGESKGVTKWESLSVSFSPPLPKIIERNKELNCLITQDERPSVR